MATAGSKRNDKKMALIMIDLDHFKGLNDEHGHGIGDELLVQVSRRIRQAIRAEDLVARYGGDEFVVLIDSLGTDRPEAQDRAAGVAEKLRIELEKPYHLGITGVSHRCTSSLGVVLFQGDSDPEDVLKKSDQSMYVAKQSGRNGISIYGALSAG